MFSKTKLREALRLYTEAVMWASPASEVREMPVQNLEILILFLSGPCHGLC